MKCVRWAFALLTAGCMISQTASAAFLLLDDFDSYDNSADTRTSLATGGVWMSEFDDGVGGITSNSNVLATDKGQSLVTKGGAAWRGADRDLTGTDAAIAVGETKTYFWQVQATSTGGGFDFMMGLSPSVDNIDITNAWQDFNVMPFVNNAADTPFINADGPDAEWWAPMNPDEWYNVWVVVNNDATSPSYDLYYSAGSDAPTLVSNDAYWRNTDLLPAGQALNAMGFMAAGGEGSTLMIDNIYYAAGSDLSNPVGVPEPSTLALCSLFGMFGTATYLRSRWG